MPKLILCGLVVVCACLIGNYYSMRLVRRRDILRSYISLLTNADSRLRYTAAPLCALYADNFAGFLFVSELPFSPQWRRMADMFSGALNKGDIELLYRFGDESGNSDEESQHQLISLYCDLLGERLDDADNAIKQKCRLYRVGGFSAGMCIALMLL